MPTNKLFYLNPKIKRINLNEKYSEEEVKEYIKCSKEPEYFIEKYVKINSLDTGLTDFKLRGYQKKLIKVYHKKRKVILLSPRQSGKTTTTAAFIIWYVFFHSDKTVAIMATNAVIAREILSRILLAFETIPFFLQPGTKILNKGSIELGNNSKIFATATTSKAIRGYSINLLYLDEFAHINNAEEFYKAAYPTITSSKKTKIIISSTPNGLNLFHKLFTDAQKDKNEFYPFVIHWTEVPDRDEKWVKEQIEMLGEFGFRQEFGNEFLGSANTLINGEKLRTLVVPDALIKNPKYIINKDPIEKHIYVSIVDVAKGNLGDFSTITIIDVTTVPYEIVYHWKCNETRIINFPNIIVPLTQKYNNAFLVVERNGLGEGVVESCWFDYGYDNMASTVILGKRQVLSSGFGKNAQPGVAMTKAVKRLGCSILKGLIEEDKLIGFTEIQINELGNFISKNGTFMASTGNKDDLVMNLVMFAWLTTQNYYKELSSGGFEYAAKEEEAPPRFASSNDPIEDEKEDIRWLLR